MNKRLVTLLFSLLLIGSLGSLAACENSQSDNENSSAAEKQQTATDETGVEERTKAFDLDEHVPTMERINTLEDVAMTYYFGHGDLEEAETDLFPGVDIENKYDVMEEAFKRASIIDPYNMDLKFSLASVYISKKETENAINTYEELLSFDKRHSDAQVMHAVFSKVTGNQDVYKEDMEKLREIDSEEADRYERSIQFVDDMKDLTFEENVPDDLPTENHGIVVLGYALSDEGEMQEPLLERLKVAEAAANEYPDSKIIVTGGVPKEGVTEADVMYDWLVEQGIDEKRILKENMAKDTIENALFSMEIVNQEELEDLTLITSATHMRRALTLFNEANEMINKKNPMDREFSHIIFDDYEGEDSSMSEEEEFVIYRDLMRTSGIWLFPGLQR